MAIPHRCNTLNLGKSWLGIRLLKTTHQLHDVRIATAPTIYPQTFAEMLPIHFAALRGSHGRTVPARWFAASNRSYGKGGPANATRRNGSWLVAVAQDVEKLIASEVGRLNPPQSNRALYVTSGLYSENFFTHKNKQKPLSILAGIKSGGGRVAGD